MDFELINFSINKLKLNEGFRSKPYKCTSGKLTIGYGRNIEDVGISNEEAEYLLSNDVKNAYNDLNKNISFFNKLSFNVKYVLIDMCVNMGISKLLGFKKMILALSNNNFKAASVEMLNSVWANQVGKRAKDLSKIVEKG